MVCCLEERRGGGCHVPQNFQFPTNTKCMFSLIFTETVADSLPPESGDPNVPEMVQQEGGSPEGSQVEEGTFQ